MKDLKLFGAAFIAIVGIGMVPQEPIIGTVILILGLSHIFWEK